MMKAIALTKIGELTGVTFPDEMPLQPGEVLIRVKSIGVCGSDVHYFKTGRIGSQVVDYPFLLGHEFSGVVEKTAPDVVSLLPGTRVAVDPAMPCYACDQCLAGRSHTCRNLRFLGCPGQAEGCMREFVVMPATSCFAIPQTLTFDDAMLCEPLSIGIYAAKTYGECRGKTAAVIGFGPIGMSVSAALIDANAAAIVVSEKLDYRLDIAGDLGIKNRFNPDKCNLVSEVNTSFPQQIDVVFECCGQQDAVLQAINLLKPGGTLVIVGIPSFDSWYFPVDELRRKEITIKNVRRQNECVPDAIALLQRNPQAIRKMITHKMPFGQSQMAFDMVSAYSHGVMKAVLEL
jgi:L-iditol 2-dehydrogenase